jgi:type II secretory pathway component PulK
MRLLLSHAPPSSRRRGSALLMAFLVLIVLAAIVWQLSISTATDARVASNDVTHTLMDQAIESALLKVTDDLRTDGESSGAAAGGGAGGEVPAGPQAPGGEAGGAPGGAAPPVDSHEDSWGRPQRTTIGDIELRILVQDEDSKLNLLTMLTPDEDEARKAFDRIVRVLDMCREGTSADIDLSDARKMAEAIRDHLQNRSLSPLARSKQLSDVEEEPERGLALSMQEFGVLPPFEESHLRDFRDERGTIVHSIAAFLTVWTALQTEPPAPSGAGGAQPGQGGNTGPQQGAPGSDGAAPPAGAGQGSGGQGGQAGTTQSGAQAGQGGQPGPGDGGGAGPGGQGGQASASGGVAVNVNTAPAAVLKALMDEHDVSSRYWDEVIKYRNLEKEPPQGEEEPEPVFDEFGEEIIQRQVFESLQTLGELPGYERIDPIYRTEMGQLLTTQSQVFTVYVSARKRTGAQDSFGGARGAPRQGEREDQLGNAIVRTVRAVFWRRQGGTEVELIPIVRWEVIDYTPFEVQDFPDPDR